LPGKAIDLPHAGVTQVARRRKNAILHINNHYNPRLSHFRSVTVCERGTIIPARARAEVVTAGKKKVFTPRYAFVSEIAINAAWQVAD